MRAHRLTATIALGLLLTALGAGPAGTPEPFRVRLVTMEGRSGAAYYSSAARTYRFVGGAPQGEIAQLAPAR